MEQHPHDHDRAGHTHEHARPTELGSEFSGEAAQLGPSSNGTVMIDIGGDYGALMLMAPDSMALAEPELSPVGNDELRTHVAIRERRSPAGTRWAAIYPKLLAGDYTLWGIDGRSAGRVKITGGEVTQVDWR